jgi:hypothetical protein
VIRKKTPPPAPEPAEAASGVDALAHEVRILNRELTLLRKHRMFVLYQSVPRVLLYRMLTGMAVGLGTVIGATFLLSIIVWMLSQIEFLPIIGEWASEIARTIEQTLSNGE